MYPYFKKVLNVLKNTQNNQIIARPPTLVPSVSTPNDLKLSIVNGSLKETELSYRISAFNEYGETIASEPVDIRIGSIIEPVEVNSYSYEPGYLQRGAYYYGVSAVNEFGETNIVKTLYVNNKGCPSPDWNGNAYSILRDGLLSIGTYYYAVTAVFDNQETSLSSYIEVNVSEDNSSVVIKFLAVKGVSKYYIYGRERGRSKRIGEIDGVIYLSDSQIIEFKDNGSNPGKENPPEINLTTSGIKIEWTPVEGNISSYKIYGRTSPNSDEMGFIGEVKSSSTSFIDDGISRPSYSPQRTNTTGFSNGAGVLLKWSVVPEATGYKIYGRGKRIRNEHDDILEEKGLLTVISDRNITSWIDSGSLSPDKSVPFPVSDSTDGTKGILGSIIPDGETLEINQDGVLSVKGGIDSFLGRSIISNLKDKHVLIFDEKIQRWVNFDLSELIFTLISIASINNDGRIVSIGTEFEDYKETLINSLNQLNAFASTVERLENKIDSINQKIENVKRDIGTSFSPELQD